jgi:hypothetical protein
MGAQTVRYANLGEFTNDDIVRFEIGKVRGHHAYLAETKSAEVVRFNRTTSIKGVLEKDALVPWAAKTACEYIENHLDPDRVYTHEELVELCRDARRHWRTVRDEAGGYGTQAHKHIELWFSSGHWPDEPRAAEVDNALGLFSRFWDDSGYRMIEVEKPVYLAALCAAGLLDLLCWDADNRMGVIDYKTSSGIWADFRIQVSAYVEMGRAMGLPIEWAAILHIGKYDPHPRLQMLNNAEIADGFKLFKLCAHAYPLWKKLKAEQDAENKAWRKYVAGLAKAVDDAAFAELMNQFMEDEHEDAA